jgi:imidazolonepropionase
VVPGLWTLTHVVCGDGDRLQRRRPERHATLRPQGAYEPSKPRAASEQIVAAARRQLDEMAVRHRRAGERAMASRSAGTAAVACYQELNDEHAIDLVPTFWAPDIPEARVRPDDYVALVISEMIPRVAADGLAEWCDVFCDEGAFTPQESVAILSAGARAGLKPRIHADELALSGGSHAAAKVGARSADHLIFVDEEGADALAATGTCAVLLPIAAFYLKIGRFAPARMLIDRGVPVALGTDINPGAGFSPSMPFAMTLACFAMQMTLEEALVASTLNAAWSLDRAGTVGSLEPGKLMDAVVIDGSLTDLLRVGPSPIHAVIKRGQRL